MFLNLKWILVFSLWLSFSMISCVSRTPDEWDGIDGDVEGDISDQGADGSDGEGAGASGGDVGDDISDEGENGSGEEHSGGDVSSEDAKAVFRGEFPLTAIFRSGPTNPRDTYQKWMDLQHIVDGHLPDIITYPLAYASENVPYADRFAEENPATLMLTTWRAASGTPANVIPPGDKLERSNITFPGHWVLLPGSVLSRTLTAASTQVLVSSAERFPRGPALLVETGASGEKLWDRFEYVLITRIDGNELTVRRSYNGSPSARQFPAGRTYVAPIASDSRTRQKGTNWVFNITADCPKDPQGRQAADILLERMVDPLKKGGQLEHFGGIDFASGPFGDGPSNADYDCDGQADSSDEYVQGVRNFLARARSRLGLERVLTMQFNAHYVGSINGSNLEGLVGPRDPWSGISKTVNRALAWQRLSDLPMVSLAFVQYLTAEEERIKVQLHRLLNGYATCLGVAATIPKERGPVEDLTWIELFKGTESEAHWLGMARGPVTRAAALSPNLLGGDDPTDWDAMLENIDVVRGSLVRDGDELVLRPNSSGNAVIELNFGLARKSDFTVFFEARSEDEQITRKVQTPNVSVPVEVGPVYTEISSLDYLPNSFYVRGAGAGNVTFDLRFSAGGEVRFRSLGVHSAPDTLACEFENGVVLVNPSLEEVSFDLTELFSGRAGYRRLRAPEPRGSIPTALLPQYRQTLELNSGKTIGDPTSVVVPERNALFLIAD